MTFAVHATPGGRSHFRGDSVESNGDVAPAAKIGTVPDGGLHRGEARLIGEDGSKYDDRRFFTVEVDHDIPVAESKPGSMRFRISTTLTIWSGAATRRGEGRGDASYDHCCRSTRRRAAGPV